MDTPLFHQFLTVASGPQPVDSMPLRPQKSITKTYAAVPQRDSTEIELARVSRPAHALRDEAPTAAPSGQVTPDLEMSRPASPVLNHEDGVEALQSMWEPYMNRFRLLSACSLNLMNGMNDAAAGPLIPHMEKSVWPPFGISYDRAELSTDTTTSATQSSPSSSSAKPSATSPAPHSSTPSASASASAAPSPSPSSA